MDPYEVLGVPRGATQDEIKLAYRRQARLWHPDVNPAPEASEKFKQVQLAHDMLTGKVKQSGFIGTPAYTSPVFTRDTSPFSTYGFVFSSPLTAEQIDQMREAVMAAKRANEERIRLYHEDLERRANLMREAQEAMARVNEELNARLNLHYKVRVKPDHPAGENWWQRLKRKLEESRRERAEEQERIQSIIDLARTAQHPGSKLGRNLDETV